MMMKKTYTPEQILSFSENFCFLFDMWRSTGSDNEKRTPKEFSNRTGLSESTIRNYRQVKGSRIASDEKDNPYFERNTKQKTKLSIHQPSKEMVHTLSVFFDVLEDCLFLPHEKFLESYKESSTDRSLFYAKLNKATIQAIKKKGISAYLFLWIMENIETEKLKGIIDHDTETEYVYPYHPDSKEDTIHFRDDTLELIKLLEDVLLEYTNKFMKEHKANPFKNLKMEDLN